METILGKLFQHNNWANERLIQACSTLGDDLLDAEPQSITKGSIRTTLEHLIEAQVNYSSQLSDAKARFSWQTPPTFSELEQIANDSGEGFLALIQDESSQSLNTKFQRHGNIIEPWVVMVQAINHATEHREQIKSMMSSLGVTPPEIDGWAYGRATGGLSDMPT